MNEQIEALERRILDLKQELSTARRAAAPQRVGDSTFPTVDGRGVRLSELFGGRTDLLVVHNMGRRCAYCTLWADGFNGVLRQIESRAAFVVCTPDEPAVQREFAASRGWEFTMVSAAGTTFTRDMGFEPGPGLTAPGVSAFRRGEGGVIERVGRYASFGPGDDFCPVWHLFDLLDGGAGGWSPAAVERP